MAKKRTHVNGYKQISVRVPTHIADAVSNRLHDPVYDRVAYGAMSRLVTNLMVSWLEETPAPPTAAPMDLSQFTTSIQGTDDE